MSILTFFCKEEHIEIIIIIRERGVEDGTVTETIKKGISSVGTDASVNTYIFL
jgi:hypothetical protein